MIDNHPYVGPDRRLADRRDESIAENIRHFVHAEFQAHEAREMLSIDKRLEAFKAEAFVDGPSQHKHAHQAMIDASKAQEKFWSDLGSDIAKKSIWGILQVLVILAAAGIAAKFGISVIGK